MKMITLTLGGSESYFDWVYNYLRECRKKAGISDNQIYDYPEFRQYDGYFSYGIVERGVNEPRVAYIRMPEEQFTLFKLRHCK